MGGAVAIRARGQVIQPIGGEDRRLCLTLGTLAELETAFDVSGWEALSVRLRSLSAKDMMVVLAALLRGGGEDQAAADLATIAVDFREAALAVAAAFMAAGEG
jgi:Phage tail tube protein, GTA-gp10